MNCTLNCVSPEAYFSAQSGLAAGLRQDPLTWSLSALPALAIAGVGVGIKEVKKRRREMEGWEEGNEEKRRGSCAPTKFFKSRHLCHLPLNVAIFIPFLSRVRDRQWTDRWTDRQLVQSVMRTVIGRGPHNNVTIVVN